MARDAWPRIRRRDPARVIEQHRSGYIVADGPDDGFTVESLPEWQRPSGYRKGTSSPDQRAAVGDWVLLDGKRIVALLPRRTAIKRGAAGEHYKQQVIAANIDTVLVVVRPRRRLQSAPDRTLPAAGARRRRGSRWWC